jgi:TolA-binding protein
VTAGRPCPDDLLAARRRRPLTDLERHLVEAHLAGCGDCRAVEAAAQVLRPGAARRPGDEALVERVAGRASARLAARSRGARRAGRLAVAAAVSLCVGAAAYAWVGRRPARAPQAGAARVAPALAPPVAAPGAPGAHASDAPAAHPPAPPARVPRRRAIEKTPEKAPDAPEATAASLFAAANAARRAGDLRGAQALYRRLRAEFPGSAEARLASISVGDLLVGLDDARGALAAFDAYLVEMPDGPLREEALFGRARSLRKLGRGAAERDTWRTLLREFPRSAYEDAARRRLEELPP